MRVKIIAIIPAKNEANYLNKTLNHLKRQTIPLNKIIVVDDASTDETPEIARKHQCKIIRIERKASYELAGLHLPRIINRALKTRDVKQANYIMILGADHLLPSNYIEKILNEMIKDSKLVIASGVIKGEESRLPRGSGRIYKSMILKLMNYNFPINYGWEAYPIYLALKHGLKVKAFSRLITVTQRKTSMTPQKYFNLGRGMRALSYHPIYALARILKVALKSIPSALKMLAGYLTPTESLNLSNWMKNYQKRRVVGWMKTKLFSQP